MRQCKHQCRSSANAGVTLFTNGCRCILAPEMGRELAVLGAVYPAKEFQAVAKNGGNNNLPPPCPTVHKTNNYQPQSGSCKKPVKKARWFVRVTWRTF